jgi:hypothetical protein
MALEIEELARIEQQMSKLREVMDQTLVDLPRNLVVVVAGALVFAVALFASEPSLAKVPSAIAIVLVSFVLVGTTTIIWVNNLTLMSKLDTRRHMYSLYVSTLREMFDKKLASYLGEETNQHFRDK